MEIILIQHRTFGKFKDGDIWCLHLLLGLASDVIQKLIQLKFSFSILFSMQTSIMIIGNFISSSVLISISLFFVQ